MFLVPAAGPPPPAQICVLTESRAQRHGGPWPGRARLSIQWKMVLPATARLALHPTATPSPNAPPYMRTTGDVGSIARRGTRRRRFPWCGGFHRVSMVRRPGSPCSTMARSRSDGDEQEVGGSDAFLRRAPAQRQPTNRFISYSELRRLSLSYDVTSPRRSRVARALPPGRNEILDAGDWRVQAARHVPTTVTIGYVRVDKSAVIIAMCKGTDQYLAGGIQRWEAACLCLPCTSPSG